MTDFGTFVCEICDGVFGKSRSDAEAMQGARDLHGQFNEREVGVVCSECHAEFMLYLAGVDARLRAKMGVQ